MRLARRLMFAVVVALVAVLALHGYQRARREASLLDREGRRDHLLLGRALSVGMAETWRRAGEGAALALIDAMNQNEPEIDMRWIWLDAPPGDPHAPAAPRGVLAPLARRRELTWIAPRRAGGADYLYTYIPVRLEGARAGAIELSESRAADQQFVRTSVRNTVVATLAAVLACALVVVALGVLFVGRPVRRLVAQARRVGAGDFTGRLPAHRRDELGELAAEMNAMCDQLALAHERVIAETSARLTAQQRLEHADRLTTVGKLAAGIAHELGTPLNVIAQRAQMVLAREVKGDAVLDKVRIIAEQTDRMAVIIRQLLDFARRREPQPARHDLAQIAHKTASLLAPLAQKRGVTVELATPRGATPVPVDVDAAQIQQALTNLVVNGLDAMPRGGRLTLTVDRLHAAPPAEHAELRAGEYHCVAVRDEGTGIPEAILPQVFEPFFTTKGVGEGTGLGLSVAYGLVREHGGWIGAESRLGAGSCFTIYLPVPGDTAR